MNGNSSRKHSRSRSPEGTKLHVKNLPLHFSQDKLQDTFEFYGRTKHVKIIRKGPTGQPLRDFIYGFVLMDTYEDAKRAMEDLNNKGWSINFSKEIVQKSSTPAIQSIPKPPTIEQMPTMQSFQDNAQATNIMLLNNANPKPGQVMDQGMLERLLTEHQPSCLNISNVPEFFKGFFI